MLQLLTIKIDENTPPADLERIRRNMADVIAELQRLLPTRIRDVSLANATPTPIPHKLGRPAFVTYSPPRGASATGRIEEVRDSTHDRTKFVVLMATGWGATITVDLEVR